MTLQEHGIDASSPASRTSMPVLRQWSESNVQWVFLAAPGTHTYDLLISWIPTSGSGVAFVMNPVISAVSVPFTSFGTSPG